MREDYANLRAAIYDGEGKKGRFCQLAVNSVMATDTVDKDLENDRNACWSKAFTEHPEEDSSCSKLRM
jgi:hypothetical protein